MAGCVTVQKLREVWSLVEKQQRGALNAQRQHEETVSRLRHEGAARMREAALSRHELLQQVDALTTRNGSSDTALVSHSPYLDLYGSVLVLPAVRARYSLVADVRPSVCLSVVCPMVERTRHWWTR